MTDPFPLVVFDLDGTLAETAGDLMGALNHVLSLDGLPPLPVDQARSLLGAGGRALIRRGFASAGRPLDENRLEDLFRRFLAFYEDHIADHSHLYPGVVAAMDRLEADGFAFAVCTNKLEGTAKRLLAALGVADRFKVICGQDTFAVSKPEPGALLGTIARAGGDPARCVMVGDSRTDIDTAKAARIPCVAVDFGYTDRPVATFEPDRVISHFDALADAVGSLVGTL
ncbi:phosphoglycolate phosphatase [Lichenibacterium minor]|uniref:Phosphoglycolate phosphatase n=1 Tax=Lichenibacterium minor TaxID=2316528 RepID=A0A4Q2UA69_9HYPH|nr:HAD family hydrolase [Lichenibacterium minor]RYC33759.1 phosphoglycolate phosphatase [Lichenibacterium minor]